MEPDYRLNGKTFNFSEFFSTQVPKWLTMENNKVAERIFEDCCPLLQSDDPLGILSRPFGDGEDNEDSHSSDDSTGNEMGGVASQNELIINRCQRSTEKYYSESTLKKNQKSNEPCIPSTGSEYQIYIKEEKSDDYFEAEAESLQNIDEVGKRPYNFRWQALEKDISTPNENGLATATEQIRLSTPISENRLATPTNDNGLATPINDNGLATPTNDNGLATPINENGLVTPIDLNGLATPINENELATPNNDNGLATPINENGLATPTNNNGLATPINENGIVTPINLNGLATPINENELATPINDNGVATPINENGVATPINENELATPINENGLGTAIERDGSVTQSFNAKSTSETKIRSNEEKRFACTDCGKLFTNPVKVKRHMKIHTERRPLICGDCGKEYITPSGLKYHMMVHRGEKPFVCDDCGKRFIGASVLKCHRWTHTEERPFTCADCGRGFMHSSRLKYHTKVVHTGGNCHRCTDCGMEFTRLSSLKVHMTRKHTVTGNHQQTLSDNMDNSFNCDVSNKSHNRRRSSRESKKFLCDKCPRSFARKCHLAKHMKTHNQRKMFHCRVCSESFFNKTRLRRHEKTHSTEKIARGVEKEISTNKSQKTDLEERNSANQEERKHFQCDICSESLVDKSDLKRHESIHAKQRLRNQDQKICKKHPKLRTRNRGSANPTGRKKKPFQSISLPFPTEFC